MSNWAAELIKTRRYLRDPNGNIWSEELLRRLWSEVQSDVARRTRILEDVRSISVPPRFAWAYTHEWEWGHSKDTTSTYHAFHGHGGYFTCTAVWEVAEFAGIEADIGDAAAAAVSFPWEVWHAGADGALPARFPFPRDFKAVKSMYYDKEPLPYRSKKDISSSDPSWINRAGEPQAYFREDELSNEFIVWPRPSTASWVDVAGSGQVDSIDDESVSAETGAIVYSEEYESTIERGITIDSVDIDDSILLFMDIEPLEPSSGGDELSFPQYLTRYIRFGVLARAFAANTDGKIESLARLWDQRYEVGVKDIKRFMGKRSQDRDYRLVTQGAPRIRTKPKMPRLPDGYPALCR